MKKDLIKDVSLALDDIKELGPWKKLFIAVYQNTGSIEDAWKAVRWVKLFDASEPDETLTFN